MRQSSASSTARPRVLPFIAFLTLSAAPSVFAQGGELGRLCEVSPKLKCLDKSVVEGQTFKVPLDAVAVRKDGFAICDSSFNYTTAPDIVLIMDNTGSMAKVTTIDGVPRWCENPALEEKNDPGCISGDPNRLRGPALKTFLDSALVKGGKGMNVGVVTFSEFAEARSQRLLPLNAGTLDSIKASITMFEDGQTNYTAAFRAAYDLLATSLKPKSERFIIFVSDGRPNLPRQSDGGPHLYKEFLDTAIAVHSIFLGANSANFADMQEISRNTGGLFFNIDDVTRLAGILTNDIARTLFRRASPTFSRVANATAQAHFDVAAGGHVPNADSTAFTLDLPGPMQIRRGVNDMAVKTEYGFGGTTQDVHFKIERTSTGPFADWAQSCREPADLQVLRMVDGKEVKIAQLGQPYLLADTLLRYSVTTAAPIDSFDVEIRVTSPNTAQQDLESVPTGPSAKTDTTWRGSIPFEHQQGTKRQTDKALQVDHGETAIVTYRHPYIPEDSAQVKVRIKYGPDFRQASYWDLDGDGRIETVRARWLEPLAHLPAKLQFTIADPAGTHDRTASGAEIKWEAKAGGGEDRQAVTVTLANPFPRGVTSVSNPDSSGRTFRQADIPLMDGRFRVEDSVPPIIVKAVVRGPDRENPLSRLVVTYSEPVNLAELSVEPIVFKRDSVVFTASQIPIARAEKRNDREWAFHLAAGAPFTPVGGDSAAINNNGETRDAAGRAPKALAFTGVQGGAPEQGVSGFYVTFPNGSKSRSAPAADLPFTGKGFVPVDSKGHPIPGDANGKCGNCAVGGASNLGAAIIHVITKQPVDYELSIFTNLGVRVATFRGKVEEGDFRLLDRIDPPGGSKDPNEIQRVQRIVWTGFSDGGQVVGTGAYVLKGVFRYDKSFKTGAKATVNTRLSRFGLLRNCCRSVVEWYQ